LEPCSLDGLAERLRGVATNMADRTVELAVQRRIAWHEED
jgi:hypothetical protein